MKTTLGIILGVILGVIIVAGVSIWMIFSVFSSGAQPAPSSVTGLTPQTTAGISLPSSSSPSTGGLTSSPVSSGSPIQSNVNFNLNITNFQATGLTSGTVNAQITDTGTEDANNVWAKVEIICQGAVVNINGQPYLRVDLGTIKAGQSVSPQVTINVSLTDGIKISQNGATFRLTIYSDEKTQTLSYDYHP